MRAIVWLARQVRDKAVAIVWRIVRWLTMLPARIWRLLTGLRGGLRRLRVWELAWWRSLGRSPAWRATGVWFGYRAVELTELAGVGEAYETLADLVKFNTRALSPAEVAAATRVFGGSVKLHRVRLDARAVCGPAFSKRPYTSFHTVNGWGPIRPEVLIHELTHVWQYERSGAIYMPQALHAQRWGAGYDYHGAAGLTAAHAAGQGLLSFNREQQASIVQDFAAMRRDDPDAVLYAGFVAEVSTLQPDELIAGLPEG
jgi:hypothetical protein